MLFGKIKNTDDEWGFDVFEKTFDTFITVSSSEHLNIIKAANTQGKLIKGKLRYLVNTKILQV